MSGSTHDNIPSHYLQLKSLPTSALWLC